MINNDIVRWRYMRIGDMLEARTRDGKVLQAGPIVEIEYRKDRDNYYAPRKKYVLVPDPKNPKRKIDLLLKSVQAIIRNGVEVIRFAENEQQSSGCASCGQRRINPEIAGCEFCSVHCQQEWIERYYQDYPPGQNPIEKGEIIHTANCGECRKLNRVYCPKCVD